jgi:hypothetical protein
MSGTHYCEEPILIRIKIQPCKNNKSKQKIKAKDINIDSLYFQKLPIITKKMRNEKPSNNIRTTKLAKSLKSITPQVIGLESILI